MDNSTLAKILERTAKEDLFDGVGRIILSDLNTCLPECITSENVLHAWREAFPQTPIEQRTKNTFLIFFSGSEERHGRDPLMPGIWIEE